MLLLTSNVNFKLYLLPSFNVNQFPVGFPSSGTARTMSFLPGATIERLRILTSGSRVSTSSQGKTKSTLNGLIAVRLVKL